MASLFRPLNRCLLALKQANNAASVMQQRLASSAKPPFPPPVEGSVNKPLDKAVVDETADPKESCKFLFKLIIFNILLYKKMCYTQIWLIHGMFCTVLKDLK